MDITWHGHSCFTLKSAAATVVVDPFSSIGLTEPKLSAEVLLISHAHDDHSNLSAVSGNPYLVDTPGEYESHGVMIEGLPTYHDNQQGAERGTNIVFSVTLEDMHLVHLGDLGHTLDNDAVERLGNVDVLFVPVGGELTIDAKAATEVIKRLQPRVTVPMHYQVPGLKLPVELASVEAFLKESGRKPTYLDKATWKIKATELPNEEAQTIIFPNP